MRVFKVFLLCFFLIMSVMVSAQKAPTMEQQLFVESLLPVIDQVNSEISTQRKGISTLYREFKTNNEFPQEKTFLIYNYLKLYRCDVPPDSSMFVLSGQHFKELLKRVDIIPRKLVLAQAAIESNWGTSRFTIEGNNYFGIRCTREGCGISPKKATGFYVKKYPDLIDSVRDYMRLLNSGKYYESFRDLRIVNRLNTDLPDPFYIVKGLEKYSSRGKVYINNLILIMKSNFYYL